VPTLSPSVVAYSIALPEDAQGVTYYGHSQSQAPVTREFILGFRRSLLIFLVRTKLLTVLQCNIHRNRTPIMDRRILPLRLASRSLMARNHHQLRNPSPSFCPQTRSRSLHALPQANPQPSSPAQLQMHQLLRRTHQRRHRLDLRLLWLQ
jgi:hypothetical protein